MRRGRFVQTTLKEQAMMTTLIVAFVLAILGAEVAIGILIGR
jgi:hypothetical protein